MTYDVDLRGPGPTQEHNRPGPDMSQLP